ncbi:hypothetical protein BDZ90DRAFT_230726 [Jaminaea rosea]|uniref:Uncharacterized protein n=1 Tax=Jaminaea rosea TaxID=1569628 RepID=A0A316UWJ7_9BASI|nr:hypothetical protein BDZ90DRAFT_230726 [Jaminaea rosea]PWN28701.1 hypothetical protein BDZ90DRAFT_230726 [Jaminaea rosea]
MGGSAFPFGGSGLGGGGGATAAAGSFFDDDFFSSTLEPFPSHRGGLARESLAQPRSNFRTGSSYSSSSFSTTSSTAGASRHTSQQRSTRIVNGVREEVTETRDARGNVTVHMTRGDGSQSVHVNGVEQASHPLLEGERTRRGSQRDGDRDVGSAGRPITVD